MENNNIKRESNPEYKNYWIKKLSGEFPTLNLPSSKLRPNVKSNNGRAIRSFFSKSETEIVHNFILNNEESLFACLLATWNILFYRYTSQRDIILGTKTIEESGSNLDGENDSLYDIIIFREELDPFENFNSFYDRIKNSQLSDFKNQPYSFDQLVTDLDIIKDKSRNAIFDIMVTFNKTKYKSDDFDNSFIDPNTVIDFGESNSKFDIEITFQEAEDVLFFDTIYNTDVYENDMIESLITHFKTLLLNLIAQPTKNVDKINYLSEQELDLLLNVFNQPEIEYPKNKTIVDLFQDQVKRTPDNIAVVFNEQKLTYNELNILSNQLANYLINKHQIIVGDLVGIMLGRSEWMIVSIIGILKSGAAYVPIDPNYPEQRKSYIQNDSKCKFTIDESIINDLCINSKEHPTQHPSIVDLKSNNFAYVIYTSGTTGNPKGVLITHKSVVNLISYQTELFNIDQDEKILQFSSYCFDASVEQIFLALLNGSTLNIISEEIIKNHLLLSFIENHNITHLHATPSYLETLTEIKHLNKIKRIVAGGEICTVKLAKRFGKTCDFYNKYGPTENTVTSTIHKYSPDDDLKKSLPIGKPISNTRAYILSPSLKPQGIGIIGELCVSGLGLSQGYLNLPELTSEKFIPDPYSSNSKMYRTGDLARWLPNGTIEFIGRKDDQVKIRGHRIELGEIESKLMSMEGIKTAVVLAKIDILVAFIVVDFEITEELDHIRLLRKELALKLPSYMMPNIFHILEKIPTTSNGKVDKKLLLEYKSNAENKQNYTAPRTEEEEIVASIWKECLNMKKIDIFSDFFEMGGHSINAVKIIIEIEKHTGKKISLPKLFEHSTIEKFAKLLSTSEEIFSDCLVPLKPNGNKTPLFMVHGGGLNVLSFVNMSKHFDENQPFYGLQGVGPKGYDDWYESVEDMAAHYIGAIEKINPKGPYSLAGFCVGGIVAFEMCRQLKAKGKEVNMLALLDSYADSSYYYKTLKQKKLVRYYARTTKRFIYLKEMLTSWKAFKKRFNAKKDYIHQRHFVQSNAMTEQEALAHTQFTKAASMIHGILDQYHLKSHSLKVDLIRSKDHPAYGLAPTHLGWKKAALKGVTIHNIPGDNFDIRESPYDKVLAGIFQKILDERNIKILLFFSNIEVYY